MNKVVLAGATLVVGGAASLLGLVILLSSVGATARAVSCAVSSVPVPVASGSATTTTSQTPSADCGLAAPVTLPTSPVRDNGLPVNYVLPAGITSGEAVALTYALAQLGKPYLWGGVGLAAYDCSGLTMMAWRQAGVTLLHYTGDQILEGRAVASVGAITPGDLVLVPGSDGTIAHPGHVGIYLGDGLVESAVDPRYGIVAQPYDQFVRGGLSGIRYLG